MSASPRTAREALLAEMLGDLDSMLARIENLPQLVENCEARLSAKAAALDASGEKYGQAVAAYTEQAKEELADFLERESKSTLENQVVMVQQMMRNILLSETESIKSILDVNIQQIRLLHLALHGATALLASLFMFLLLRFNF